MTGIKPIFSLDDTAWFMLDNRPTEGTVIEISILINNHMFAPDIDASGTPKVED